MRAGGYPRPAAYYPAVPADQPRAPIASVVVPTRDRQADLERMLRALARQRTERSFEVIVVDDGSEPPVDPSLLAGFASSRLVRRNGGGPAAARNAGAAAARGAFLLFTDDDTEPAATWVDAACEFLEANGDHVGVEGPVASPPFDPLYEHSLENDRPGGYWTCNMAYRRRAFEQLGGFLEDFPDPHCEDLDLAFRALRAGPIGFAPAMGMTHFPRPLPLGGWIGRARLTRSEALLFERHPERFGRVSRLPARLFPIVSAAYGWRLRLRAEVPRLLRSPRRLARFGLVAGLHLGTVVLSALGPRGRADDGCYGRGPR
jgi:GT2 family glycosyltransferase